MMAMFFHVRSEFNLEYYENRDYMLPPTAGDFTDYCVERRVLKPGLRKNYSKFHMWIRLVLTFLTFVVVAGRGL